MSSVARRASAISLAAVIAVLWADPALAPPRSGTRTVRLAVTGAVGGELSTCGCASGPQGGLGRRSARLDALREEDPALVLLDAGGYASIDPIVSSVLTDSLASYMAREGYAAVGVGDEELAAGFPFIGSEARARVPRPVHVSANLFRAQGGELEPLAEPYVLVDVHGVRVGITSVLSLDLAAAVKRRPAGFRILEPLDAARRVRDRMREQGAELLVLLAHVPESELFPLGRAAGYDVVVSGHEGRHRVRHGFDGGVVFVHPGDRGRYVAEVELTVDEDGMARVAGGTRGLARRDPLSVDVQRFVERSLSAADAARRLALLRRDPAPVRDDGPRGAPACASCHRDAYESWRETPHARAFDTLEAVGMDREEACVACHVTGFGEWPAHPEEGAPVDLRGVQCESCHLVGRAHPEGPEVPAVEPATCRRCHDAENSPDYDLERYWPRVLHREAADQRR